MSNYSPFDNSQSQIPKPKLNGGLYTGTPFKGVWGNTYVKPDTVSMTTNTLMSANPPPKAPFQFGNTIRPGNNDPDLQNVHRYSNHHDIVCTGSVKKTAYKNFNPFDNLYASI